MALAPPDSEWSWTFRLLRGEILVLQRQPAEVEALIAAPLPPAASYSPLRARQKFVEAMLQRSRNQFDAALATLETARRLAPDAADVQFDIAWLDGQLRMRVGQWSEARTAAERRGRQGCGGRRSISGGSGAQRSRHGQRRPGALGRGAAAVRTGVVVPGPRFPLHLCGGTEQRRHLLFAPGRFQSGALDSAAKRHPPHRAGAPRGLRAVAGRRGQHADFEGRFTRGAALFASGAVGLEGSEPAGGCCAVGGQPRLRQHRSRRVGRSGALQRRGAVAEESEPHRQPRVQHLERGGDCERARPAGRSGEFVREGAWRWHIGSQRALVGARRACGRGDGTIATGRGVGAFRSSARHDREDPIGAAQDGLQALVPDAAHSLLPILRGRAGQPGPDRSRARGVRVEPRPCPGRPQ